MTSKRQSVDILQLMPDLLIESGVSYTALFEQPELQAALKQPNLEIVQIKIIQAAIELSNDPTLPLRLGQRLQIASFGTIGFALMSCKDLREVIKLMIRYHPIVSWGLAWELHQQPNGIALRARLPEGNPSWQRLIMEASFSAICSMGKFLLNRTSKTVALHLNYPAPSHAAAYQQFFAMPVTFDQLYCQLLIPEQELNSRLRTANPAGHLIFLQQCEEMLRDLNQVENTSAAVRRLLIQAGGEFPAIKQVAQRLHISERTLRRRLSEESTTFRKVCGEVRNVLACQYLSDTQLTVAEIADLLNYTETVSFRRAFVRWNGLTPSQYRLSPNLSI